MPDWRKEIRERLAALRLPPERESEIVEELAQHLDDRYRELCALGRPDTEAAAAAWRELEATDVLAREVSRVERPAPADLPPPGGPARRRPLVSLATDLRFALRTLRKSPSFSIPVLLAMALSIGPTTAIVSVSNWMLWQPLPGVQQQDDLAVVWFGRWFADGQGVSPGSVSARNIADLKAAATTITGLAGAQERSDTLAVGDRPPEVVRTATVTADYFRVLGLPIRTGRDFTETDDLPPLGAPVVIISDGLARQAYGGPDEAVGQRLTLNQQPFDVIGVAPAGFAGINRTGQVDVWYTSATMPYVLGLSDPGSYNQRGGGAIAMFVARLADDRTWADVETELTNLAAGLGSAYPDENEKFLARENREAVTPRVFPGLGEPPLGRERTQRTVLLLLGVGGVLVLLGCANVANLMVFRASRREREVAVRKALGASQSRLIQLQLTESWTLAVAGAALGLLLAVALKTVLQDLLLPAQPGLVITVPLDVRVLGITLALATLTGVIAGLAPAWLVARGRVSLAIGGAGGRSVTRAPRLRGGLAVAQLALSLTLLIGALLLVGTVRNLRAVDLGFNPAHITWFSINLPSQGYSEAAGAAFWRDLQAAARAGGPFEAATVASAIPFGGKYIGRLLPPGAGPGEALDAAITGVAANYFAMLEMTFLRGRGFTPEEAFAPASSSPMPVVLSETTARRLFGTVEVVGRTVRFAATRSTPERDLPIIGVVRDARDGLTGDTDPFVFMPMGRFDFGARRGTVMVRSLNSGTAITSSMRALVGRFDRNVPVPFARPLIDQVERGMQQQRLFAWTLSVLSALGFILAALGVYGLVAQTTAERSREFGIRMAIGAGRANIAGLVIRFAAAIAIAGMLAGLSLAWFGSRTVASMLYGITPLSPGVYLTAIATLALIVAAACAIPALRAMRVEPVEVLRAD